MAGQYDNPIRVVAFNKVERRSNDISEDIAHEIRRRADIAYDDIASTVEDLVASHVGREWQLALRLA